MSELLQEYGLRPRVPRASAPRWMITFGDLLTLLLCFFITCITLGPLGKRARGEVTIQDSSPIVAAAAPEASAGPAGTSIAPTKLGQEQHPRTPFFNLYEGQFDPTADGPWRKALDLLTNQAVATRRGIDIVSCAPQSSVPWGRRLAGSWDSGVALRRQVVDRGVPPEAVRVRVLGTGCGASRSGKRVMARLKLSSDHG